MSGRDGNGYAYALAPACPYSAACRARAPLAGKDETVQGKSHNASDVLNAPNLEEVISWVFYEIATSDGGEARVRETDMKLMAEFLTAMMEIDDDTVFGDIGVLFYKYDYNCDGLLDLAEAADLIKRMLWLAQGDDGRASSFTEITSIPTDLVTRNYKVDFDTKLGQGGQGAVYLAESKYNGQACVVKTYDKKNPNAPVDDILNEFNLLKKLMSQGFSPYLPRVLEMFQDDRNIYTINEKYSGGDLSKLMKNAEKANVTFNETYLGKILRQVIDGLAYLHKNKVMHCDLKEQNVMVKTKDSYHAPDITLIDFGMATKFCSSIACQGTPGYMPPEVWTDGLWTPRGDTFSLGVMSVNMYCAMHQRPEHWIFDALDEDGLYWQTCYEEPDLSPVKSPTFKSMVALMLTKHFLDRPTVAQVLEMEWWGHCGVSTSHAGLSSEQKTKLARELTKEEGGRKSSAHEALTEDLAKFHNFAAEKKLNDIFKSLDLNQDGSVTVEEATATLSESYPPESVERLVSALFDGSKTITYIQFMAKMIGQRRLMKGVFRTFDKNKDGCLNKEEFAQMLEKHPALRECLGQGNIDINGDGVIERWEIRRALKRAFKIAHGSPKRC